MAQDAAGVLARFGEVFLKRGRKRYFLDCLAGNLERALFVVDPTLKLTRPYGRFLVVPKEEGARIADPIAVSEAVAGVFGIVWAGPVEIVRDPTVDSVSAAMVDYALTNRKRRHRSFKIITRRANKNFPLTSIQCNQRYGGDVYEALEDCAVDIHEPDLELRLELRVGMAFIFGIGEAGVGGLPVGSNGKTLLLLSGGIDSPVAGWLTQKRGVVIDAVTFLSPPYTGPQVLAKVEELARRLASSQRNMRLWVVEITALQEHYRDHAPGAQLVLLYRRSMIRIADRIAQKNKHLALITGENLGQVASQTLPNLHVIGSVATRPVLRPLITYDKHEIITVARKIDTYETSILPFDDCCSLFVPAHPELRGRNDALERIESRVDPTPLEEAALAAATVIEFGKRKLK
ncbi:MAG: thiamine biosynthesis protein ThiI [Myxococcota bacterium]|jgi:thiamine biosynthesis protein ThiI